MKKILVVEDDEHVREGLVELLELSGYKVFTGLNGIEGINLAKEILPDLILCDIMMPKLDGYKVKEELDKDIKTSKIPFIYLTAKAEMSDFRSGMLLGADDYIVKPFRSSELLEAIKIRIEKKNKMESPVPGAKDEKDKISEGDHIFINAQGKPNFVKIGKIICITAEGNDSKIHLSETVKYSMRRSLTAWEEILPSKTFKRIHRSSIINLNYVESISRWSSGTYLVHLKGIKETFTVSQRHAKELRSNLI